MSTVNEECSRIFKLFLAKKITQLEMEEQLSKITEAAFPEIKIKEITKVPNTLADN